MSDRNIRMCKGMFFSFVAHSFCVVGMMLATLGATKSAETEAMVLTLELPGGGGGGKAEQIPGKTEESQIPPTNRTSEVAAETVPVPNIPEKIPHPQAKKPFRKRSCSRQLHLTDLSPLTAKASTEPFDDAVPMVSTTTPESKAPTEAAQRGELRDTAMTAPDEGNSDSSPGKGDGVGSGLGSGMGTGRGSGLGSGVGSYRGPGRGSLENLREQYMREQFAYIRNLILQHLIYPQSAKQNGWQGKVRVSFIIREDGTVADMGVVQSSGYRLLDLNVLETIQMVQPFPKPPVRAALTMPVSYVLK